MNSTFNEGNCDFVLSGEDAILYMYTSFKKTFILLVVPIIVAFGLFGNAALLFVVYRIQEMRTITNFYLSNLAVSDTLLLISTAFRYIWSYFAQPIDFGPASFPTGFLCAITGLWTYLCYFTSVFMVILVTFERYLAICHPIAHRLVKGKSFAARMTAGAWFMSLLMAYVGLNVNETETICIDWLDSNDFDVMSSSFVTCKLETNCSWCWPALAVVDFAQFAFAVIVSVLMYGRIIYTLSVRSDVFHSGKASNRQTTVMMLRAKNQIARMLILNGTVFFLCLAPFELVNLDLFFNWWAGFKLFGTEEESMLLWIGRIAMLLNSAINPILYNVSNGRYRKAFAEAFGCSSSENQNSLKTFPEAARTETTSQSCQFDKNCNI